LTSYIVAYRIHNEEVHVLTVMHGAQRWPRSFDE
jgi:plasmid stabilization system protein ParE